MRTLSLLSGVAFTWAAMFAFFLFCPSHPRSDCAKAREGLTPPSRAGIVHPVRPRRKHFSDKCPPRAVAVMTFHDLSPGLVPSSILTSAHRFEKFVRLLKQNNFRTFFASDIPRLVNGRYRGLATGSKPVVLTFDDGYINNYRILFPILQRHKIKVTIFLIVRKVEESRSRQPNNALTWREISEMADSGLVEFASHTYDMHFDIPLALRTATDRPAFIRRLRSDLERSAQIILQHLGSRPISLSWPHGRKNAILVSAAKAAGFKLQFNAVFGINIPGRASLCDLRRINASSSYLSARALLNRLLSVQPRGRMLAGRL